MYKHTENHVGDLLPPDILLLTYVRFTAQKEGEKNRIYSFVFLLQKKKYHLSWILLILPSIKMKFGAFSSLLVTLTFVCSFVVDGNYTTATSANFDYLVLKAKNHVAVLFCIE